MVVHRIILLAMLACFAASRHVVPRQSNYFTVDKYVGTWFTLAMSSKWHINYINNCIKTRVTKVGSDNQSFSEIVTAIDSDRARSMDSVWETVGKVIDSVLYVQDGNKTLTFTVSKFNNGNQYILHRKDNPYSHNLVSRSPKAPQSIINAFKRLVASFNGFVTCIPANICDINPFFEFSH